MKIKEQSITNLRKQWNKNGKPENYLLSLEVSNLQQLNMTKNTRAWMSSKSFFRIPLRNLNNLTIFRMKYSKINLLSKKLILRPTMLNFLKNLKGFSLKTVIQSTNQEKQLIKSSEIMSLKSV